MSRSRRFIWPCLLSICATACAAQTDPSYPGDPLAAFHGSVVVGSGANAASLDAAIVFIDRWDIDASGALANRVGVRGSFPAQFRLEVYAPPPPPPDNPTFTQGYGPQVAIGVVAAIASSSGPAVQVTDIAGVSVDTGVVWFGIDGNSNDPNDIVSTVARQVSIAPTKGYHLFRQVITQERESAFILCQSAGLCDDLVLGNDGMSRQIQPINDRYFEECRALQPDAPTCTWHQQPSSDAEAQETARCLDLRMARDQRRGTCPAPQTFPENAQGLDFPITITLGKTVYDWLFPSATE